MASLDLEPDQLKAVEQTRQRLSQISSSIGSVKADVYASNPLPSLDSLQASADILQHNVRTLLELASQHSDLFSRLAVHPSTNFPGRTQENILLQLLRKKPEPDIASAQDEGRKIVAALMRNTTTTTTTTTASAPGFRGEEQGDAAEGAMPIDGPIRELEDIWVAARDFCNERIMDYAMNEEGDPFTEAEHEAGIEHVRTGLRRTFYEDEDEEDEDEGEDGEDGRDSDDDDVMVIDRPPPPPAPAVATQEVEGAAVDNVMRFAARGEFVVG
ncbi:mediator of RNA polymerase II transcription complex subunit 8-domain-containing protein [Whalleya microplaca]|nr:mediator of RNA polymerase II transcription complex subunit 8-domain-containing protein [Whalleya microplaca]